MISNYAKTAYPQLEIFLRGYAVFVFSQLINEKAYAPFEKTFYENTKA